MSTSAADMDLGARIAQARRRANLSQSQFARRLGVSLWAIDQVESGLRKAGPLLPGIESVTQWRPDAYGSGDPSDRSDRDPAVVPKGQQLVAPIAKVVGARWLILGSLTLLIVIRFFTEVVVVVPRAANFVDIPIFLSLAVAALFVRTHGERRFWYIPFSVVGALFVLLSVVSAVLNSTRVEGAPVLVFLYGFLAPLAVYALVYRLWPIGNARLMSTLLVSLGLVELLVVALVDLPRFTKTRNPDDVSGTFGTNAYQLVFFLLLVATLGVGVAVLEPNRWAARLAPIVVLGAFATILLAQYRALLLSLVVAIGAMTLVIGRRGRGLVIVACASVSFAIVFHYVATSLPKLKLSAAASGVASDPGKYARGRLEVIQTVLRLYGDLPQAIAIGTGPGTYSSRAWQTFATAGSTSRSNVAGAYTTGLTNGMTYTTDVSTKYVVPQIHAGEIVQGSRAVSSPYASYASLLAEVGIPGFALIVGAYLFGLGRAWRMATHLWATPTRGDPLPALALATAIAFLTLLQMGALENWFEVTRVTFLAWALLAVCGKELDARIGS